MQLCFQTEFAEEKSQALHSQKSPCWAQQIYITKEKHRYSEYHKKNFMRAPNRPKTFWQT